MHRQVTPLEIQVEGGRFAGFYAVHSSMLTVWHASFGSRTAQIAGDVLAEQVESLMHEIWRECVASRRNALMGLR